MSVAATIARYSSLPAGEVRELPAGPVEDLDSTVLFVLATWSGQSIAAFRKLTERLATIPEHPSLVVGDIDSLSAEAKTFLGDLRGTGETFWIRSGHVIATLHDYAGNDWSDAVSRNCAMLRGSP